MSIILKVGVALTFALLLTFFLLKGNPTFFGAGVFIILFPIFFARPVYYFIFFMIIRPIVDLSLRGNLPGNKLSVILVIPFIFLCIKDIFLNQESRETLRDSPILKKINFILLLLLITYLMSFITSRDRITSLMDLIRYIAIAVSINYTVINFSSSQIKKEQFIKIIFFSSLAPLLFGFKQAITKTGVHEAGFNRIFGTFAHQNVYAEYLVLVIFLAFYMFSRAPKKTWQKKIFGGLLCLYLLSLCLTYTRTLWIAFAISILMYIFLKRGSSKKIVYLVVILSIFGAAFSQIKDRFKDISHSEGNRSSWQWRIELWRDAIKDLQKHPFLGNGLGMFEKEQGVMAHNDYLRTSYESGIPSAFITLLFFIFLFSYSMFAALKASDDEQDRFLIATSLVLTLFIASQAVNTLRNTTIMVYYLSVIAIFIESVPKKISYENPLSQ